MKVYLIKAHQMNPPDQAPLSVNDTMQSSIKKRMSRLRLDTDIGESFIDLMAKSKRKLTVTQKAKDLKEAGLAEQVSSSSSDDSNDSLSYKPA